MVREFMIRPRGISSGHFDGEELFIFSVNVQCGGVAVNHSHTDSVLIVLILWGPDFFLYILRIRTGSDGVFHKVSMA